MRYARTLLLLLLLILPSVAVAVQNDSAAVEFKRSLYGALNTGDAQKLATLIDRVPAKELDDLLLYSLSQSPKTPVEVVRLLLPLPQSSVDVLPSRAPSRRPAPP